MRAQGNFLTELSSASQHAPMPNQSQHVWALLQFFPSYSSWGSAGGTVRCVCEEAGKKERPVVGEDIRVCVDPCIGKRALLWYGNVGEIRHKSLGNQALLVLLLTENFLPSYLF